MSDRNEDRGPVAHVQGEGVEDAPLHEGILSGATTVEEVTNHADETPSATAATPVRIGSVSSDESAADAVNGTE